MDLAYEGNKNTRTKQVRTTSTSTQDNNSTPTNNLPVASEDSKWKSGVEKHRSAHNLDQTGLVQLHYSPEMSWGGKEAAALNQVKKMV
jgi:hypothetical protein